MKHLDNSSASDQDRNNEPMQAEVDDDENRENQPPAQN